MHIIKYAVYLGILLIICSCSIAYTPNVINAPLLGEKGDVTASAHVGASGLDIQAAGAVTDHLGLMANTSFIFNQADHQHNFVELGTGYFTKIGSNGRFETYGGLGFATYFRDKNTSPDIIETVKGTYTRAFLSPSIGASSEIFQGSLTTRLVVLRFYEGENRANEFLFEPVITAKVGYKYAYLVLQGGFSIPVGSVNTNFVQPFILSIGVQGNLNLMSL